MAIIKAVAGKAEMAVRSPSQYQRYSCDCNKYQVAFEDNAALNFALQNSIPEKLVCFAPKRPLFSSLATLLTADLQYAAAII